MIEYYLMLLAVIFFKVEIELGVVRRVKAYWGPKTMKTIELIYVRPYSTVMRKLKKVMLMNCVIVLLAGRQCWCITLDIRSIQ